jgi:hypothetical protein
MYFRNMLFAVLTCLAPVLQAQQGIGLRFASNLNYFHQARDFALVQDWFSTGVLGVLYSKYGEKSGFEFGTNVVYKNASGKGFPNLPVVMQDLSNTEQNVGITALEMDLKVGPRFRAINPKIGYVVGYRFRATGFQEPGFDQETNRFYLYLPFGASANWPTRYGSVGFGAYYLVGITNALKNPAPGTSGTVFYDGGRMRAINLEMVVTFNTR